MNEPELSLVIPLRDEEANVLPLHAEFTSVLQSMRRPYQVILVEGGSCDQTFVRLAAASAGCLPDASAAVDGGQLAARPRVWCSTYGLSRTFTVVKDLLYLSTVMRAAIDPAPPGQPIYEIAERREPSRCGTGGTGQLLH